MSIPVLDRTEALSRLEGDEELLQEVTEIFLEDAPTQINILRDALEKNDGELAMRQAHSLKSASANIGAEALSAVARQSEAAAKEGGAEAAKAYFSAIEQEFSRLKEALAALSG